VRITKRQILLLAIVGFALSLAIRLIHYNQSLWCDEMGLALDVSRSPWTQIVAAGAGGYTPNNHVLHTILVKAALLLSRAEGTANVARVIRLPSLIAGALIPLALAWLSRDRFDIGIALFFIAACNPWLVSFSDEARGYALMTLLGIVATGLLPDGRTRWPIGYPLIVGLMIYTVPVAGMLVIGHGIAVYLLRRRTLLTWLRAAIAGGLLAALLFLPMAKGIWFYMQHPQPSPDSFVDFANQLPRFAAAGEYVPAVANAAGGIIFWIVPVVVLTVGTVFGWRQPSLRLPTTVMASATLTFLITAMVFPGAGQLRFVPWCALWLVIAVTAIAVECRRRWGTPAMVVVVVSASGWFIYRDIVLLPSQPIRDAIVLADTVVPADTEISVGFLVADESVKLYGSSAPHHVVTATPGPVAFLRQEQEGKKGTGHLPWLVMSYEEMVRRTTPQFWAYIQANYELRNRLPGRISPVAIYAPRNR
jgi:hypothetical protein